MADLKAWSHGVRKLIHLQSGAKILETRYLPPPPPQNNVVITIACHWVCSNGLLNIVRGGRGGIVNKNLKFMSENLSK